MAWASQGVQAGSGGAELAVSGPLQATLPEDEGKGDTLYSPLIVKAWSFYKCKSIARPYVSGHPYNIWHPEALMQLSSSHECGLLQGEPQSSFLNNHPCSPITSSAGRIGLGPEVSSGFSSSQWVGHWVPPFWSPDILLIQGFSMPNIDPWGI